MQFFLVVALGLVACASGQETKAALEGIEGVDLSTLITALEDRNLFGALDGASALTIFAPINSAFTGVTLPTGGELDNLLKFHVVGAKVQSSGITDNLEGASLYTPHKVRLNIYENDPKVITAQGAMIDLNKVDIPIGTRGFIHVVKAVLNPGTKTIAQYATDNTDFSKLVGALNTAELAATLGMSGPYTVFAPINSAKDAAVLESDNVTAVTAALKYHVVDGAIWSAGIKDDAKVTTLSGDELKFELEDGKVYINDDDYAMVTTPDVSVSNGVIHVVNRVLSPDWESAAHASSSTNLVLILMAAVVGVMAQRVVV